MTYIKKVADYKGKAFANEFPDQALRSSRKGKKWREDCVGYLSEKVFDYEAHSRRKSRKQMRHYWDVLDGKMNAEDMADTFDPLGVNRDNMDSMPAGVISYNPLKKGFRTLFNEEYKRKNTAKAVAINADVINEKDLIFQNRAVTYMAGLQQQWQEQELDEGVIQKGLQEIAYWRKHDLQSAHETMANQLLDYFKKTPSKQLAQTKNKGFQNLTVLGEQVFRVGSVGNEPNLYLVDSENFLVLGLGSSDKVEDGWGWVEWDYKPLHKIIEENAGTLSKADIKRLSEIQDSFYGRSNLFQARSGTLQATSTTEQGYPNLEFSSDQVGGEVSIGSEYVDEYGNILVTRVQWVSQRLVYLRTYFDEEDQEQTDIVDENYEANEALGETLEELWVDEIWEGERYGEDMFRNIRPCISQMRSIDNPAVVRPYYVGTILNYGYGNKASSIMDDLIPWKRQFDLTMNKITKLWAKHTGNALRISKSMIPKDMDETEWYRWFSVLGIIFEDDFNMDPNSGGLAGNMQNRTPVLSLSVANDIDAAIQQLNFIQAQIDSYMSTPPSRTGELRGDEGLGVTQQSIIGATLSTEDLYLTHEHTMLRAYEVLIEYTKQLWAEDNTLKQYLLDDMSQQVFDYDGKLMTEAEFGVVFSNSSDMREAERDIELFGHAMAQNGLIDFSDLMALRNSSSVAEMQKRLEAAEERKRRQEQEAQEREAQLQEQAAQQQLRLEERKHEMELEKINLKGEWDLRREQLRAEMQPSEGADENGDGVQDDVELKAETIKANAQREVKRMEVQQRDREHRDNVRLEEKALKIKEKEARNKQTNNSE